MQVEDPVSSGGAEKRRLSRMSNTSQGGATQDNTADDTLLVDQGFYLSLGE
jgi:hypothetical protein